MVFRVQDNISSGLDSKIIDLDGGIHENRLREEKEKNTITIIQSPLPSKGWTSSLCQLPPFSYGCVYAHLIGPPLFLAVKFLLQLMLIKQEQ